MIFQKPISIVAPIEGTTRDIITIAFNIAGFPVILADTAGLRDKTNDPIEHEGIQRAKQYAANADLIILIVDVLKFMDSNISIEEFKRMQLLKMGIMADNAIWQKEFIIIANKCDLVENIQGMKLQDDEIIFVSCLRNHGINIALNKIERTLRKLTDCDGTVTLEHVPPNQRHRLFIKKSLQNLHQFRQCSNTDCFDFSIAAVYLRESLHQLDNITGRTINNEEMYDFIFKQFCIRK